MKHMITSADPISAETKVGIRKLKRAIADGNNRSAREILNGKKYNRPVSPVQFENDKLIDHAKKVK